jgi:replication-associated recombination protein RarA
MFATIFHRLEDLVAHEDIISILTKLIDSENLPHLLLYGPPGTGKVRNLKCPVRQDTLQSYRVTTV